MSYQKKTILLIAIATLARCIIAICTDLGNDEVYYRMYAQQLQWNYFDHPPMVGWLIRLTTANLWLDNELFIRLGAICAAAITTWLLYLCGKKINSPYTGFLAASLYTATVYGSIIAGTFILPDSPQMVCWSASLYLLLGITEYTHVNQTKKRKLLLFGIVAGLGMLCKIHTVFLWLGFLLYILLHNRQWLKEPVLYISGFISLAFFYPAIQWNIDHHFITYAYHGKRVSMAGAGPSLYSFATFTAGQVLYTNLLLFPYLVIATIAACKNRLPILASQKRVLLCCSFPLLGVAAFISCFNEVLPHWTGPAYLGLLLLTACWFSKQRINQTKQSLPIIIRLSTLLLLLTVALALPLIHYFPGTLGKKESLYLGDGDFTLDMYGWGNLRKDFATIVATDIENGKVHADVHLLSNKWFPAAHLDYYVAMPLGINFMAIGDTNDIHQYAWLNATRAPLLPGADAYSIVPSNNYMDAATVYGRYFSHVEELPTIVQYRNGKACRKFYLFRLKDYKGNASN